MTTPFIKNGRKATSPRNGQLFAVFVATVILTLAALPQGVSFSSEIHRPHEQPDHSTPTNPALTYGEPNGREEPAAATLDESVPGPGAFLGTMLGQLAAASAESDAGIKKLASGIPQILPDFYKVLVAL